MIMSRLEEFTELMSKGENRLAAKWLRETVSKEACRAYGEALGKIYLVEAAKLLNERTGGFFCDADTLANELFAENPPSEEEVINGFCTKLKEASKADSRLRIDKAKSFINKNICSNQLSVSLAAEFAGVTQSRLVALFKEAENVTPGEYIGTLRCRRSEEYLLQGFSVEKTAEKVGFGSQEGYIRMFKKINAMTPGEWKRLNRM